jgi:hypothetical protein
MVVNYIMMMVILLFQVHIESFIVVSMYPYAFKLSIGDLKFKLYSKLPHVFFKPRQNSMTLLSVGIQESVDEPVRSSRISSTKSLGREAKKPNSFVSLKDVAGECIG